LSIFPVVPVVRPAGVTSLHPPNTRTPAQLLDHLRHAPAGLPDGPATDAAETITRELITLLRSL
jgi:hypothetical protein